RASELSDGLNDLIAWIACLADARSTEVYAACLEDAGLRTSLIERHDDAVKEMVRTIGVRLLTTEVLAALKKIDLPGVDLEAARRVTHQARIAAERGQIGYGIVTAVRR